MQKGTDLLWGFHFIFMGCPSAELIFKGAHIKASIIKYTIKIKQIDYNYNRWPAGGKIARGQTVEMAPHPWGS